MPDLVHMKLTRQMPSPKTGKDINVDVLRCGAPVRGAKTTIWESDVTCPGCSVLERNLIGPLVKGHRDDVRSDHQASASAHQQQKGTSMSDILDEVEGSEAEAEEKPTKSKKHPLPEGWVTPVAFAHRLSERLGLPKDGEIRPQIIYGYVKNGKDFPSARNTDGAFMVNLDEAFAWYDALQERKETRKAKKEAEASKETASTE